MKVKPTLPTLTEMANAVSAIAVEHIQMVLDIDEGRVIAPSQRDIDAGAVDVRHRALCLAAAANLLRTQAGTASIVSIMDLGKRRAAG